MRHRLAVTGKKLLNNKRGVILVFTFAIMLALGGLAFAFLYMASTQTKACGYSAEGTQALWLAEAGMEKYLYLLKTDETYRDSYPDLDENLGSGSYLVSAVYSSGTSTYTLTSTGTAGNTSRKVRQTFEVEVSTSDWSFENYGLFFGGGAGYSITVSKETLIQSDIFSNGDLIIADLTIVEGDALATGSIELKAGTVVTGDVLPFSEPPAPAPVLDTTYYDAEIATASGQPLGDMTISGPISGTTYVNGNVTITGDITGSGTIVALGTVSINGMVSVGDDIELIAGSTLHAAVGYSIGSGCKLYSSTLVHLLKDGNFGSSGTDAGASICSPGNVTIEKGFGFYGLVFSDGDIFIEKDTVMYGTLSGSGSLFMDKGATLISQTGLIDFNSIPGLSTGDSGGITITPQNDWDEIAPAS